MLKCFGRASGMVSRTESQSSRVRSGPGHSIVAVDESCDVATGNSVNVMFVVWDDCSTAIDVNGGRGKKFAAHTVINQNRGLKNVRVCSVE